MVGRRFVGTSLVAAALLYSERVAQAQRAGRAAARHGHNDDRGADPARWRSRATTSATSVSATEAAVYLDAQQENLLRAQGYTIGEVVVDGRTAQTRRAEINAVTEGEALAAEVAKNGLTKSAKAKGAVNVPGHVVIQRAYTFTNYAGRFLYVEARNDLHGDTTGPTMSFTYTSPNGTSQVYQPVQQQHQPGRQRRRDRRQQAARHRRRRRRPVHVPPRPDRAARRGREPRGRPTSPCASPTPTATSTPAASPSGRTRPCPPRITAYQKDFITKYMDPTEINTRLDELIAQYPNIMQVDRPAEQDGRLPASGHGDDAGRHGAATARRARPVQAVYLVSKAMGQNGGNNLTAEFKAPAAGTLNSPLSITVTDGTWRTYDPNDADSSDGISEITIPTKDIVVNLATDATGALTTTAAQLVAALNADPAASALVTASTYAGNAGTGIVPATVARTYQVVDGTTGGPSFSSTKVKLSDYLRGGTAYWTGSFTATPPTLVRTDARHVQKGPFNQKVYRITNAANRAAGKTGVFIYCEQHAREWVGGITCLETAQRLVTNYATDPTTKAYVDNLDIFILPVVNPDGTHASFYDNSVQRRNLTNYCASTSTSAYVASRNSWGVDLNRNNSIGSIFDGYAGASSSCTSDTFSGPSEVSEPEIKNEHWVVDTFPKIKFGMNLHTHGGYFMWAPGAYKAAGRVTLPAPNIGIEQYFFQVSDDVLSHIKSPRATR